MDIRLMKDTAARSLQTAAYEPGKLGFYHTGVAVLASALVTVAGYLLSKQIESSIGLAGMGTRAILEVIVVVLNLAILVLMPFWNAGFTGVSLQLARRRSPGPDALPAGFHRVGPLLRLMLIKLAFVLVLSIAATQVATVLYTMSPFSDRLMEAMEPIMESMMYTAEPMELDPAVLDQLVSLLMPVYIIAAVLACGILVPMAYRFRMAELAVMDDAKGAIDALRRSAKIMKKRRFQFFRLELSFWWYYLLQVLALALGYADQLLPALGIAIDPTLAYFGGYALCLLVQLWLGTQFMPRVQTTYATFYDSLHIGFEEQLEIIDL